MLEVKLLMLFHYHFTLHILAIHTPKLKKERKKKRKHAIFKIALSYVFAPNKFL